MKRILIVSRDVTLKQDGGSLVAKRNERLLRKLGFKVDRFVIPVPSLLTRIQNIILHMSYGETKSIRKDFFRVVEKGYDYIFFDGSVYGGFVKVASDKGIKTICFYHNVEVEYYKQKAKQTRSFADKLMIPFIRHNEKSSTQFADRIITLNERDSIQLNNYYGRWADCILPTSFPERNIQSFYEDRKDSVDPYILFVGTNFFANVEGLKRFLDNVAPYIKVRVKVAGNIDQAFKSYTNLPKNVEFLGRVDCLDNYYCEASGVIAPIYTGSGLKTKTAEALSYGKTVIGYPEAFEGIEFSQYPGACIQVDSDTDFIKKINEFDLSMPYNPMAERLFHHRLSDDVQLRNLGNLLNVLD